MFRIGATRCGRVCVELLTEENAEKEMALARISGGKSLVLIACLLPVQMEQAAAFSPMSKRGTELRYNSVKTSV